MPPFRFLLVLGHALSGSASLFWDSGVKLTSQFAGEVKASTASPTELLIRQSRLPKIYEIALSELQELEAEPFCHRIAARLLVSNCHLLDGKDEASVLTDSGRRARDFVDSYAASLAICDLERGNFKIPRECAPFRESALSALPVQAQPQLHVKSREIEDCLAGLAETDSAWNTWISYRHKAVRFCEAARADNDKAQSILLYQRLTKVIAKLADGVEIELQKRMESLDLRARQANEAMEQMTPHIDKLRGDLNGLRDYLSQDLKDIIHGASEASHKGLEDAANLQQLLTVLVKTVLEGNSQVATAHELSVEHATQRANDEMSAFMATMVTAMATSSSLQQEIGLTHLQATELAQRQRVLEEGMHRLIDITESITTKYNDHTYLLNQAHNITHNLLDTLESATASAAGVQHSMLLRYQPAAWLPYVLCPAASLIMGSYGMPPSALRNLGLVALGELLGLVISSWSRLSSEFRSFAATTTHTNATSSMV